MEIKSVYPLNMVKRILGDEDGYKKVVLEGLLSAISSLPEKEVEMLRFRYRDKKTIKECSEMLETTKSRVLSLERKALSRLRRPEMYRRFIAVSHEKLSEHHREYSELYDKYEALTIRYEDLQSDFEAKTGTKPNLGAYALKREREELLDEPVLGFGFSVRAANCLFRSGKQILRQVVAMTEEDCLNLRNAGRATVDEIKRVLDKNGLEFRSSDK